MEKLITFETIKKIKPGIKPPPSCVGILDTLFGIIASVAVFFFLKDAPNLTPTYISILMIGAAAAILAYLEISRAPWIKTKPSGDPFPVIAKRAFVKYLGFWGCIAAMAFIFWIFPEYDRSFYKPFFNISKIVLPWLVPFFIAYFLYVEWRFPEEKDGSWHAGLVVLGRWSDVDTKKLNQHILGWLVKAFFFPNMFCDMVNGIGRLQKMTWDVLAQPFIKTFYLVMTFATTFELVFVCAGYLFTSRLFNSNIRAVENTLFGWFIAIMAYGPFNSIMFSRYFNYKPSEGANWQTWLAGHETMLLIWGGIMMVLVLLHLWADACFGLRFSNLTNRGIITNGMYRYSKHPAYVLKGLRWTMLYVPFFVVTEWDESLRLTLLLCGVHIIYYLRAMTEEKLLSQDPVYIEYGLWMDKNGLFSWVGRLVPHAKYENRLRKWVEKGELVRLENPVLKMDV